MALAGLLLVSGCATQERFLAYVDGLALGGRPVEEATRVLKDEGFRCVASHSQDNLVICRRERSRIFLHRGDAVDLWLKEGVVRRIHAHTALFGPT